MSNWIDVNEKLPIDDDELEEFDNVLIRYELTCHQGMNLHHALYGVGFYYFSDSLEGIWSVTEPFCDSVFPWHCENLIKVTHWMKFPRLENKC